MKSNILKLIAFLLPFELVVSYVSYSFFKPLFGEFYRFFFIGFWGLFLLVILLHFSKIKNYVNGFFFLLILFIICGFWEYTVTIFLNGLKLDALSQFVCGFLFPCILLFTLVNLNHNYRYIFFKYWYLGTISLISLTIVYSLYNYNLFPDWFKDTDWRLKVISFRYAYDLDSNTNPALAILGNFNKASNTFLLMLLFSIKLFSKEIINKKLLVIFWILTLFALVMMFSRLVLLWLPFVIYFSGIFKIFKNFFGNKIFKLSFILFMGFFIYQNKEFLKPTFDYLIYSKFDQDSDGQGILGTGLNRIESWGEHGKFYNDIGVWHHGMGVGAYGLGRGSKDLGTHNTFLDHFFASGIFIPFILFLLLFLGLLKAFKLKDYRLVLGFLIIITLFFREYSFSYLFVTSQGGFLFMLLLAIPYFRDKKVFKQLNYLK